MSRKVSDPNQSTTRLKISAPKPYQPPQRDFPPNSFAIPAPSASSHGGISGRKTSGEYSRDVGGYSVPGHSGIVGSGDYVNGDGGRRSPMRPARSVRRGPGGSGSGSASRGNQSNTTGSPRSDDEGSTFSPDDYQIPLTTAPVPHQSQRYRPNLPTTNTNLTPQASYSPYNSSQANSLSIPPAPSHNNNDDDLYTPIAGPTGSSLSPWEQDRSARSQMLEAQKEQKDREGKMRNAVGAFMSAGGGGAGAGGGKSRERERSKDRRPSEGKRGNGTAGGSRSGADGLLGVGGREFDGVDSVIRKIQRDFPDVLDKEFAPTTLALSLLQSESATSHHSLSDFLAIHSSLSQTLSTAVQKHYQVYAASLPAHATLLTALNRSQSMVKDTKKSLKESRELLSGGGAGVGVGIGEGQGGAGPGTGKRAEMGMLWQKERALKNMLKQLGTIESLRSVPDKLETLIGDKRFLQAALVLVRSIKMINREELLEVPALSELRAYLTGQLGALTDVLIEELHNHLYLKTFYTDSRWVAYQKGQTELTLPKDSLHTDGVNIDTSTEGHDADPRTKSRLSRYLVNLSVRPTRNPMLDISDEELFDISKVPSNTGNGRNGSVHSMTALLNQTDGSNSKVTTPEADSFSYMESLLESLAALGKLGYALEVISQRIASELFSMVENTIDEVSERNELRRSDALHEPTMSLAESEQIATDPTGKPRPVSVFKTPGFLPSSQEVLRVAALETAGNQIQVETLRDLFWTVFSKLRAVLESHRLLYEVTTRLSLRRDLKDPSGKADVISISPLEDIVKPVRAEVRTLLHDYLTDQDRGSINNRRPLMTINEVLRDNRIARDRRKILFKFGDTDSKAVSKVVSANTETLNRALQTSVPGLVTVQEGAGVSALTAEERSREGAQHKLLVTPNPFNASTLFKPYIVFMAAVKESIPVNFPEEEIEGFGNYMEDFVVKVYLPQLEERVTSIFQSQISGPNAFITEATPPSFSQFPLVKSAIHVLALLNSLCFMLSTTPFSRENYSRLIIGVVVRYYQQCNSQFKDIVMSDPTRLPLPAVWAQREDFIACLDDLAKADPSDTAKVTELGQREAKLEFDTQGIKPVDKRELLLTKERFEALSSLCYSLRWLVSQLSRLKIMDDEDGPSSAIVKHIDIYDIPSAMGTVPSLTLSSAMAQRFDAILLTFTQLADIALYTLRLEVRCRAMYHVYTALSKGNYRSEIEDYEPDPHVLALTGDMTECDAVVEGRLTRRDRRFIFLQLGTLIDNLLVLHGRTVRYASDAGIWKIKRNILAVQQSLLNVCEHREDDGIGLVRAKAYWDLYFAGPKAMLEQIHQHKAAYTFDEYNHMLNLQCKVDPRASLRLSGINFGGANGNGGMMNMGRVRAGEGAVDSDRTVYNEYLIDLHSLGLEEWKQ